MALIKRSFILIRIGHAVANIKVDVKPWFHAKNKIIFKKNLGLHGTTSEMKENYLTAKIIVFHLRSDV